MGSSDSRPKCRDCEKRVDSVDSVASSRCAICAASHKKLLQKVVPGYQPYLANAGRGAEEWMSKNTLNIKNTTVAFAGPPKSGKSTLINQLGCVVAGESIPALVGQGGGVGVGRGHNTLHQRRISLMAKSCGASGRAKPAFELTMCDLVGVRCLRELRCALLGKTGDRAKWPVNIEGLSAEETEAAIREIEARVCSPLDAVHGLVLVMTVNMLLSATPDLLELIAGIVDVAKEFRPNTGDGVEPFELPLRLVVTQSDKWAKDKGCDDCRCLLGGEDGFLKPLYAAARELGFDPLYVTPIGWLDRGDIDHANGRDPRVVVMKFLLHQLRMQSTSYLSDVLATVGDEQ
jgi:energy-coupling factor transporter ATP-binding protein EcfA2